MPVVATSRLFLERSRTLSSLREAKAPSSTWLMSLFWRSSFCNDAFGDE